MENGRLQSELDDLRERFGLSPDRLTADEVAAFVDCCRRIDNPYSAANAELLGDAVELNGVALHPLTVGASVWLDEYANRWWGRCGKFRRYFWAMAYAMVHAHDPEAFALARTEAEATRRIVLTCLRFAFSMDALKDAMNRCLGLRDAGPSESRKEREAAAADWRRIVARLEASSGIRRDEWVWGRTARHVSVAYAELRRFEKAASGERSARVRDELDDAVNALARLKKSIKDRIEREKSEAANG